MGMDRAEVDAMSDVSELEIRERQEERAGEE